jgi:lysophospholipase L1-like esterase
VNYVRFCSYNEVAENLKFEVSKKITHMVGNTAKNTADIAKNTADIAENAAAIAKNAADLENAASMLPFDYTCPLVSNENLFVKDDPRIIKGRFFRKDGALADYASYSISHPIYVKGGVTYKYNRSTGFGSNVAYAVSDVHGNILQGIDGEYGNGFFTFTPEKDCFVVLNISKIDTTVVAPADNYPETYVAGKRTIKGSYISHENIDGLDERIGQHISGNPLVGKKLSVNGDSICAGAGYTGGYAKIIGENNNMTVQNIGVGGGTIAGDTYSSSGVAKHWISRTIANMDVTADYAIVEGGVNDSALKVPLGTITSNYSSALDDTTFCGAFESMLKQLIIKFAGKKYGYIAVHQMTTDFKASNDPTTSYYWAAKKCCEKWGVPFLDLNTSVPAFAYFSESGDVELSALRTTYTKDGDGWHPNEEGYKKYYVPKIEAWLKTL